MNNINTDLRSYDEATQQRFSNTAPFIDNEEIYNRILTLTSLCPKLILAGSVSLFSLNLLSIDFKQRKPDLDFSLSEPLTEEELDILMNFFNLTVTNNSSEFVFDGEDPKKLTTKQLLEKEVIMLYDEQSRINIDIFNKNYDNNFSSKRDNLYPINFGRQTPHIVYVQSPAVTISHKMKYAFYPSYGKRKKHKDDCVDFLCKNYSRFCSKIDHLDFQKRQFLDTLFIKFQANLSDIPSILRERPIREQDYN